MDSSNNEKPIKNRGQILSIIEAYTSKLPVGELWYEERLELCRSCERNNVNSESDQIFGKALKFLGKIQCGICGCPIERKCSSRTEECSLTEEGSQPKWNRLDILTGNTSSFDLINKDPKLYNVNIHSDRKSFVLSFGNIPLDVDKISSSFVLRVKEKISIDSLSCSCLCTVISQKMISKDELEISFSINMDTISGKFSKNIVMNYDIVEDRKMIMFRLEGNAET